MFTTEKLKCETIDGYNMAYYEEGATAETAEDTMIFLHGNPTSSFLWRNIAPAFGSPSRRVIVPDLIGMGDSDKLSDPTGYRFVDHIRFLDEFLTTCAKVSSSADDMENSVILVIHDWGSALGFWWAFRHSKLVKGIVYMEAMVKPFEWSDLDPNFVEFLRSARTPGVGEVMMLEQNVFIESVLPSAILCNLTEAEMAEYRAPYLNAGEDRRPTLTWPREVTINGTPADVTSIVDTYSNWLALDDDIPKLFISAVPGALLAGGPLEYARTFKNQTEVSVPGLHFIQEDSAGEIVDAIDDWLDATFPAVMVPSGRTLGPTPAPSSAASYATPMRIESWVLVVMAMMFSFRSVVKSN